MAALKAMSEFFEEKKRNHGYKDIKYQNAILGMIDILGYKSFIDECKENAPGEIYSLIENINILPDLFYKFKYTILSDTLIIYTNTIDKESLYELIIVLDICRVQLLKKSFFSRGAIVNGKHFLENNIMVSPAFIKAYEIEQKICIYPRIIIEDYIVNNILKSLNSVKNKKVLGTEIIQDFDLIYTINPFVSYLKFMGYENKKVLASELRSIKDGICFANIKAKNDKEYIKAKYVINKYNNLIENIQKSNKGNIIRGINKISTR